MFAPIDFTLLFEQKTHKKIFRHSDISGNTGTLCDVISLHLMCLSDRSVNLEKLCLGSLVSTSGLNLMSDMSDVNVITEAQTEKGSLAL